MKTLKNPGRLVAQLRKTIRKSQSQFAAMIGVSKHTIISVENGRNQLSEKLAKRILLATGAKITDAGIRFEPDLFAPEDAGIKQLGPAQVAFLDSRIERARKYGQFFTAEDFDQWRNHFYPSNNETARKIISQVTKWIGFVIRAAAKPGMAGNRDRLPAIYQSLIDWLNETRTTFKLEYEIDTLLETETHGRGAAAFQISTLLENPAKSRKELAQHGFDFSKLKPHFKKFQSDDWLIIETEMREVWDPPYHSAIPCKNRKLIPIPSFWIEHLTDIGQLNKTLNDKLGRSPAGSEQPQKV